MTTKTKLFKSNQTQAVRLPKDVAFPDDVSEVEIIKVGNSRIICPVGKRWDAFFADPHKVSDDFMLERDQGVFEDRLSFDDLDVQVDKVPVDKVPQ
jgi:antitoxin VapB